MVFSIEVFIEALKIIAAVAVYFVWVVRYENIKNSGVNCLNLDFVSFLDKDMTLPLIFEWLSPQYSPH